MAENQQNLEAHNHPRPTISMEVSLLNAPEVSISRNTTREVISYLKSFIYGCFIYYL